MDFRDLNKTCLKDEFDLPIIDLVADVTIGHSIFSFMDDFSDYNQIKMVLLDARMLPFEFKVDTSIFTSLKIISG